MTKNKHTLLTAIDMAAASKATLRHVVDVEFFDCNASQEEFCGKSLFPAQMSLEPMLLGLSFELALKAWITLDSNGERKPQGHNLWKLFSRISDVSRQQLIAEYERTVAPRHPNLFFSNFGLEDLLKGAGEPFVQWRYAYEMDRGRFDSSHMAETVMMLLNEFENRIVVQKHRPLYSG